MPPRGPCPGSVAPRARPKRKQTRVTKHPLTTCTPVWTGLSSRRLRRLPPPPPPPANYALSHLISSALSRPDPHPLTCAILLQTAHHPPSHRPSPPLLASLIASISRAAPPDARGDVAIEAAFRVCSLVNVHPCPVVLAAVLREQNCYNARVVHIAWSTFRQLRSCNTLPTPDFVWHAFRAVARVDAAAAAVLMDFAGRVWHDAEGDVRTRVDYLSVMFEAALMSGDIGVAGAANVELGGLQTGEYVQGLRYALRVRRGETMMWRLGLPCVAYVALLERAACVAEVVRLFGSFRDGEAMSDGGDGTDVLEATFRALRRLGAAREAVELLAEMEATETFVASNRIVTMVIETCWRAGEMKLAKKLRVRAVCQ